jgi:hypothetical protein
MHPSDPGVHRETTTPANSHTITGVPTSITAFLGRATTGPLGTDENGPVTIYSFADYEQNFGAMSADSPMSYAVRDFFLNGGSTAVIVRLVERDATAPYASETDNSKLSAKTYIDDGIAALEKVDIFNLLCIPPDSFDPATPEEERDTDNSVYQSLAVYCVKRRAMVILDPPVSWARSASNRAFSDIQPTYFGIEGETGRNAAVYFPRVVEADSLQQSRPTVMPASGAIAGIFASTDASRGVWKAPAGIDAGISGILKLEVNISDDDNETLNTVGINCLRTFQTIGPVIWGARTLRGADQFEDDYKYVPIRRLALFLEESIDRGTSWTVYEPNDETLWSALRTSVSDFLSDLQRQGAFYSFFVECDKTTTTQEDINQGRVNIVVGFAAVNPAEFVVLYLQSMAGRTNEDDPDKP